MANTYSRRTWLRQSSLALAGTALLAAHARASHQRDFHKLQRQLDGLSPREEAYWELVREHFQLQAGLKYFNNASLGTSPDLVREATQRFRDTLDSFPSNYMWGGWAKAKEKVRQQAADVLHAQPDEIALTHNTTEGMNLIASSLELQPGDEIILCNHEHHTARIPWKYFQESRGVQLVELQLPLVPQDLQELLDLFRRAISPRTRLISVVHLTNTNGMLLPVADISRMAREQDILVAVDAAQSVGMLELDVKALGCDFLASSGHKWLFGPKGTGIFYARKEVQQYLKPMMVCYGYQDDMVIRRFENYNTRNLPEVLGLGAALDYRALLGAFAIQERIYELKYYLRNQLAGDPRFRIKTPAPDTLSAGIINVELVNREVREVKKALYEQYTIDVRPMTNLDLNGLRISLAPYNTLREVDFLLRALRNV